MCTLKSKSREAGCLDLQWGTGSVPERYEKKAYNSDASIARHCSIHAYHEYSSRVGVPRNSSSSSSVIGPRISKDVYA